MTHKLNVSGYTLIWRFFLLWNVELVPKLYSHIRYILYILRVYVLIILK
jgi:hypothetical protein